MCVDYRDLNKASPKDNFPLPHIDTLVDNMVGYSLFSFTDGFSDYNQVKMHTEDMEKTIFVTMWGTFCYKVMPFGLKMRERRVRDEECQKTFDKVKHYLSNTPVLMPPSPDKPPILYLVVFGNSMGCVLRQHDESGRKERAIYYLSIRVAIERKIKVLEVYGDSALVIYQLKDGNQMVDALATLASMVKMNKQEDVKPIQMSIYEALAHCYNIEEEDRDDHPWIVSGMPKDAISAKFMEKKIHVPPSPLHVMTFSWYFSMWGMDVIGPISPKASNGHRFIFVAIDYFTKWVEATSYANVTKLAVSKFLKKEIICQYGMPERIISDNALNLNNSTIPEVCSQFKIKHHNSSLYRPKMNGAVEAANKNIKKIVGKITKTYKGWHDKLPFALYVYRTSIRTSTRATPFSLVYGMVAVLPIEVEIPSLRVLSELKLDEAEWIQSRYDQLNLIEEKRLKAIRHGQMYQKRMMRAYDKKFHPREFHEGDLVLKNILPIKKDFRGKWMPNWEGPYLVKKTIFGRALILTEMDGKNLPNPVNSDLVKKYFT
ncbi:RNA-directed DNA polymerase [Gossypium australe]|uniref:RNA-directed DNA polymerase n=1 Tax=Gossypium australe TaxID=47621 RepID=A0A5B6UVC0_9ROSI|nr:RNA-directed DNA polymerase [Gossypium australe]